jgi:hypothetical protein
MPNDTYQSSMKGWEDSKHSRTLIYRLGTSPTTWPTLVVYSLANTIEMYDGSVFDAFASGAHYSLAFNHSLAATLAEYDNLPTQDRRRAFVSAVGAHEGDFQTHETLTAIEDRLAAEEARSVLNDPDEEPIPWEQAKEDLGL